MNAVSDRWRMLRTWTAILFGRSYRHRPQDIGTEFVPDRLHGYFVDLTAKTEYEGPRDTDGLPLTLALRELIHHPTVVLQYGLGHWDRSLRGAPSAFEHRREFMKVAAWTASTMDERGGLPVFPQLGFQTATPYSAMTQGLAASVLARASSVDAATAWAEGARLAAGLMVEPIQSGGTSRLIPAGLVLEEGPLVPPNTILNGWLFGIFGLHDALLAARSGDAVLEGALGSTLAALAELLPAFDAGWWSRYDLDGHLASPFYQRLHIAQLTALELTFPVAAAVGEPKARWRRSLSSPPRRARAILHKASQQLIAPPPMIK